MPAAGAGRASAGGVSPRRGVLPAGCGQYGAATDLCTSGDTSPALLSRSAHCSALSMLEMTLNIRNLANKMSSYEKSK